jgi:hypothetical protein
MGETRKIAASMAPAASSFGPTVAVFSLVNATGEANNAALALRLVSGRKRPTISANTHGCAGSRRSRGLGPMIADERLDSPPGTRNQA